MTESSASVVAEFDGGLARLTLNNPTRKNAITLTMAAQIMAFCARVEQDLTIGAVIVDAAGDYFCSGADTRDLGASSADPASTEAVERTSAVYGAFVRIGSLAVPTIAVLAGGAVGAGLNLAMATDLLLVTPDAVLDSGFLARGIHPGGGHFHLLGKNLGWQAAMAMGLFGQAISGEQAVALGFAWKAAPRETIGAAALELVRLPASDPALARRAKHNASTQLGAGAVPWPAAVEVERGTQMWSLRRKGEAAWHSKPVKPVVG